MIENIEDLRKELIKSKIAESHQLLGCTSEEIEEIEKQYGILPSSYKQIMQMLGRRAGKLVNRYEFEFYIDQTPSLNQRILEIRAESLLEGESILDLPGNIFFISARYGDNKEFILTNTYDDSPVYGYGFPYGGVKQVYSSVWSWIQSFVEDAKALMALADDVDKFAH